jgi:hypothetical protein
MLSVTADLDLVLVLGGERTVAVPASLMYAASNPYAVTTVFRTSDGDVTWVFGRDLLEDGLREAVGEGDVVVWPSPDGVDDVVYLSLASPSGSALLEADAAALRLFLDQAYLVVPRGCESDHLDMDAEIADLLGDTPTTR